MKLFHISSKSCSCIFYLGCLLLCALLAWRVGSVYGMETVWVARERIVDAVPTIPLQQFSAAKALTIAAPLFLGGAIFSLPLTELFYAALTHFRNEY